LPSFARPKSYPTGPRPVSIAINDLDGDRKADLATGNVGGISVLLNKGDGGFQTSRQYAIDTGGGRVAAGDLNGDGIADLATASAGGISVLLNTGDGSLGAKRDYRTPRTASGVAIGDLNGDG